ncbi:MAG TPA: hypothetical protein PLE26_00885 [Candidatus Paceibacterota bacterium]|nr:hypothetical protein [Candidatus Paceibacterota bacterium]HQB56898.1 hypothetical protein [Candidatus Paceibacterota bacterium]
MPEENKLSLNLEDSEPVLENEEEFDYDFLKKKPSPVPEENTEDIVTSKFDTAFENSSKTIQDYILGDKLEESIRLICKIEKLEGEKAQIIIENIAVSILVGLLPINEAKETLIESFRSSGIILEPFTASSILKSIDTYILTEIRKKILESKIENNKEIRHLTLKEKREETQKEELRKILLERTGTITGKGEPLIQYKEREKSAQQIVKEEEIKKQEEKKGQEMNRESLLAKINMQNVSDTDKMRERMAQIRKEEQERLEKVERREKRELERIEEIRKIEERYEIERMSEMEKEKSEKPEEKEIFTQVVVEDLKEKLLAHADQNTDLNNLRIQRGEKEAEIQKTKNNDFYKNSITEEIPETDYLNFDPYRENL